MRTPFSPALWAALCFVIFAGAAPADSSSTSTRAAPNLNPAASRLGPEIQITPCCIDYNHPAIAYISRHDEYQVFFVEKWSNGSRNVGRRSVSASGQRGDGTSFYAGGQRTQPAIAYNARDDQFLMVWMKDPTGTGAGTSPWEIWGDLCSYTSSLSGFSCTGEFLVFKWANRSFWTPRVAWNSYRDEYFVIWNAMDTNTMLPTDVAGVHVSPSGVVDGLAHIITTANYPQQADIAYNLAMDEYLVVWRYMYNAGDGDIWGARVKWDGTVNTSFYVNQSNADQQSPALTTNQQDRYMVVWQERASGADPWQIIGQELDVNGNWLGGTIPAFPPSGDQTSPAVVAKPGVSGDYVVVGHYADSSGYEGIIGSRMTPTGSQLFTVQLAQSWNYDNPAVAIGRAGYLVAYEGIVTGIPSYRFIYGRLWWPEALYLPLAVR